jgi:predicted dehydrogenase
MPSEVFTIRRSISRGVSASEPSEIGIGVLGYAFMGKAHSNAFRKIDYMTWPPPLKPRLMSIAGRNEEAVSEAARRYGYERWTSDWRELIDDPGIGLFDNLGPNDLHAEPTILAAEAGKHVVCEKPLAVDPAEAEELVRLASAAGVTATVPFVYRFYPMVREARSRVADGTSGPVRLLHGSYLQDWLAGDGDDDWRVDAAAGGASRAFADIGVHWCDLVEFVSGHRITRVAARTVVAVPERGGRRVTTEDAAVVLFETDGGATGNLTISQVSQGRKNRLWFSIDGSTESLCFDQEHPESLWIGGREVNRQLLRGTSEHPGAARYTVVPAGHPQGYQDCFDAFLADTYAAVGGEAPDGLPTFADGLRAARITQAVLDSSRSSTWVDVAP